MEYLINKTTVDFSYQNHKGLTALDIFDQASGNVHIKLIQQQVEKICEIQDNNTSEPECSSKQTSNSLTSTLTSLGQQKHLSERRQGELAELYRSRQSKQDEIYSEAVQNARNTITLVAILICSRYKPSWWHLSGGTTQRKVHGVPNNSFQGIYIMQ